MQDQAITKERDQYARAPSQEDVSEVKADQRTQEKGRASEAWFAGQPPEGNQGGLETEEMRRHAQEKPASGPSERTEETARCTTAVQTEADSTSNILEILEGICRVSRPTSTLVHLPSGTIFVTTRQGADRRHGGTEL